MKQTDCAYSPLTTIFVVGVLLILTPALQPASAQADTGLPQPTIQSHNLPIGLTEEEMTRLDEIGMYHSSTAPPATPIRRPAQWEPVTGALIRYYNGFGLPVGMIREYAEDLTVHILCVAGQQTGCYNYLNSNGVNMANVDFIDISTNSMWTRDYGPQGVFAGGTWGIVDHIYNRPRPLDDDVNWQLGPLWGCSVYGTDLVHTGGNFLFDGHGTGFSTDLVWDENPGMTHAEIARWMEDYLGIDDYVVLPDVSSTGIHHIDCWMKVLNEETILVKEVAPSHAHYDELEANVATLETLTNCYGRPYNIVRVYCGSIGGSAVAAYTNSMILNNKVFVPLYGISTDAAALASYEAAMPGYEVLGYTGSWYSDDAIHCRTMAIHDRYMLIVDTNPLQDREYNTGDYRVTAFVDDRSEMGLVTDSLLVYWRVEGGPTYNAVAMQATAHPDSYYADIPVQADSADIEYYVFAKDNSGRRSARPVIAPDVWYTFNVGGEDVSGITGETEPGLPGDPGTTGGSQLAQNHPNPFSSSTEIRYHLPEACRVKLDIYDVFGKHVATVVDEYQAAGPKVVCWDGRGSRNATDVDRTQGTVHSTRLYAGVYFYTLRAGSHIETRKMLLL
jgi:agmatine/peptidylarginine deiminase